jgi:hypothetical protein
MERSQGWISAIMEQSLTSRVKTIEKCQVIREVPLLLKLSRPPPPTSVYVSPKHEKILEKVKKESQIWQRNNLTIFFENSLISGPRADLLTERLPRSVEVVHNSRLCMYEGGARRSFREVAYHAMDITCKS